MKIGSEKCHIKIDRLSFFDIDESWYQETQNYIVIKYWIGTQVLSDITQIYYRCRLIY